MCCGRKIASLPSTDEEWIAKLMSSAVNVLSEVSKHDMGTSLAGAALWRAIIATSSAAAASAASAS